MPSKKGLLRIEARRMICGKGCGAEVCLRAPVRGRVCKRVHEEDGRVGRKEGEGERVRAENRQDEVTTLEARPVQPNVLGAELCRCI